MEVIRIWAEQYSLSADDVMAVDHHLELVAADMFALESPGPDLLNQPDLAEETLEALTLPGVAGIWGVGYYISERGEDPRPTLFASLQVAGRIAEPVTQSEEILQTIRKLRFPTYVETFQVIGQPNFEPQCCGPGGRVATPGNSATLGCRTVIEKNTSAITTAGHGAQVMQSVVKVNSVRIGQVASTSYPAAAPVGSACADIAIIRLDKSHTDGAGLTFTKAAAAIEENDLIVHTPNGSHRCWVQAAMPSLVYNRKMGKWGQILQTNRPVSNKGDSGSPVELADDTGSSTGHTVVGHIVGGSTAQSLIQDVDYQLTECHAQLRVPGDGNKTSRASPSPGSGIKAPRAAPISKSSNTS